MEAGQFFTTSMITLREKLNQLPPERRQKIEERAQKLIDAENASREAPKTQLKPSA